MTDLPHARRAGGPFDRVLRGSAFIAFGYGASQALRLGANLILTRLLFPEAFGLMALVSVFLVGLMMFSDIGLGPSIMQHPRGDDPAFLDTAWTIQVARGAILWLGTTALAWPAAWFYDAPMLVQLLPAAGIGLFIGGLNPTRIETAGRHLMLGRVTLLDLASQLAGTLSIIVLALITGSIWSLVIGTLIGAVVKLWLMNRYLPGPRNRLRWDATAGHDLIHFGKWIFLGTICGFLMAQEDKAILGRYLSLEQLGIYNIGFFLASFPVFLGSAIAGRVLIPLYRDNRESGSVETVRQLRRLRAGLTFGVLGMLGAMALYGVSLVGFLYDPRYDAAGVVVVAMACVHIPSVIGMTYDQAALAAGDSRRFFYLLATRATLQTLLFLVGVHYGGLAGALIGVAVTHLVTYPLLVMLARHHQVWHPLHDAIFGVLGLSLAASILWLNRAHLDVLLAFGAG